MSKKASKFQEKYMAMIYRGKGILKPLNTGVFDEHVMSHTGQPECSLNYPLCLKDNSQI